MTNAFATTSLSLISNCHLYFMAHIFFAAIYLNYSCSIPVIRQKWTPPENSAGIKNQLIKIAQKDINKIYCYSFPPTSLTGFNCHYVYAACASECPETSCPSCLGSYMGVKFHVKIALKIKYKYLLRAIKIPLKQVV